MKAKGRKPVSIKWLFKSKEEPDRFIYMKPINLVKGYIQVPGTSYH